MKILKNLILFTLLLLLISCSKDKKVSIVKEKKIETQMIDAFKEGYEELQNGDVLFAAKKFNEAELLYPQSEWAPKAALMAAYAYYSQDYYGNAIAELERFIRIYPKNKNIDYAYYLLGLSYYEQIVDEKKDLNSILKAKKTFEIINKKFPNTQYAIDAEFKIELVNDIIASKEMYIGRYYQSKKKWIAAINRFRVVVDDYSDTVYTEEALHRLVEIYYTLGLKEEAKKYAQVLGYNYQSSLWYEKSYVVFNKGYKEMTRKKQKEKKNKENNFIKKLKSLVDIDE